MNRWSRRVTYANGKEGDGLVDSPERRDIDGLTTDGTLRSNTGGVLARTSVDDSIDKNLDNNRRSK